MISVFELSKSMYYRSCRLFRKIYYLINNKQTSTYEFAAACISLYAKLQCQKLFNDHSKQFPNTSGLSQHLKEQLQKRYPIIVYKRLRIAQFAILNTINFGLELQDNTVKLIDQICHKWTMYVSVNKSKINYPKLHLQIGSQNKDQRRNLLNVIFLYDTLQFFPDIVFYPLQMSQQNLQNSKINNILVSIYINIYCSIFGQYRHHNYHNIQILIMKFIKKVLKKQQSEFCQIKQMIQRSKQYQMEQHLKIVSLDISQKIQKKIIKKQKQDIVKMIHHQALLLKNFDDKSYNDSVPLLRGNSFYFVKSQ